MNLPALPSQEIPTLQFELGEKRRENETLAIWRPSANVGFLLRRWLVYKMETSLWFGSLLICAGWWQLSEANPGHGTGVWPRGLVLLLHAAPLLVPRSPPGLQGKGGCQQFWPPGEEPRWFFNFSFSLEIWKAFPHPCKLTAYMQYFYRKQPTCLSDQWATGMVCSSWSPRAVQLRFVV